MKILRSLLIILIFSCSIPTVYAAPDFPPRSRGPLSQPVEKVESQAEPKENVSPESVKNNHGSEYALSEIRVTVLSGMNLNGEKAYKVDYRLVETSKGESKIKPTIHISYKDKQDKDRYAISEVSVKKMPSKAYQVTAKLVNAEQGKIIKPELVYLN